jgi:hypothetical protein
MPTDDPGIKWNPKVPQAKIRRLYLAREACEREAFVLEGLTIHEVSRLTRRGITTRLFDVSVSGKESELDGQEASSYGRV